METDEYSLSRRLFESFQTVSSANQPVLKNIFDKFLDVPSEEWDSNRVNESLDLLSRSLLNKNLTGLIAEYFRSVIPSLVVLALRMDLSHKKKCLFLGDIICLHPDALKLAMVYFESHDPPWAEMDNNGAKVRKVEFSEATDLDLALCCWNLMRSAADKFRHLWNWSSFMRKYLKHSNHEVAWVAAQSVVIVLSLSEKQKKHFLQGLFSEEELISCSTKYYHFLFYGNRETFDSANPGQIERIHAKKFTTDASPKVIDVFGVSLLAEEQVQQDDFKGLVEVESTRNNIQKVSIGIATGKAVCLAGVVGCGKTAIVDHLAQLTGRKSKLLKVQLGEEIDSKMLLGSYRCTDLPGEFVWQPGVLTLAVLEGRWLLLEDIDSATSDVAAVIAGLLENNSLSVPGFKDYIRLAPGFHLFMTYRLFHGVQGQYRRNTNATELLEKHWHLVTLDPLTDKELISIIQTKFPVLKTVASKMVAAFSLFSHQNRENLSDFGFTLKNDRLISVRDLIKWCSRAQIDFDVSSQSSALKILQDAIDLFCASYHDPEMRLELAGRVAACLGIVKTKAEYFCCLHHPSVTLNEKFCQAGRATLSRDKSLQPISLDSLRSELRFAMTQESSCLLERVGVSLSLGEPILLVGETGTGKTTTLQLLAQYTGNKLVIINMNQQSDSADLLGGYKPVDLKYVISPLRDAFEKLFRSFFDVEKNIKFLENISVCFSQGRWKTLLKLMKQSQMAAVKRLRESNQESKDLLPQWLALGEKLYRLKIQLNQGQVAMAFSFIEGSLINAIKKGYWVLLDEINLASAETLQCLSSLLESNESSVSLLETGDFSQIPKHSNFRLLAAMNPATDIGKKDLPPGIRNRFTELFVSEHTDAKDLSLVVQCYLPDISAAKIEAVVNFYLNVRTLAAKSLTDTSGHKPHFSLRSLCRALVVASANLCGSMDRSLYEALCLSFLSQLDSQSHNIVSRMIEKTVCNKVDLKSITGQPIPEPTPGGDWILFEGYWIRKGPHKPQISDKYLLTTSVRRNLNDLARLVSLSNHPVLIQGETSVGKTSLVTWLSMAAGHPCLRINNHQHTDLQEYIGTYVADPSSGNLVFNEGVLVQAMRQGYWIILDELNLAPSEVLEALNRVLDDNRELFIAETQSLVKAHPSFRLFATQNPPGLYGGRKVLSRAFRNRFVELHFDTIPSGELEEILKHRCDLPLSYCKKMVAVMQDLQVRRRGSAAFAGKQGYITLRDLFRWGERYRLARGIPSDKYYDWDQHIADEGYLVLAGRVRKFEESETIREVLEKRLKRKVILENLFTLSESTSPVTKHILEKLTVNLPKGFEHIVWTFNIRKLGVLLGKALEFVEPVLLVGETGCGKTTICQLLSALKQQSLHSVNCHLHTESSDFLGGLRPVRDRESNSNKLFEWVDGPLIDAMKSGGVFLADEISLADDSVLERLNSLLEPERKLLVSEKGSGQDLEVVATENFRFIGTMNPGGDYGKKELSPALRNRLTEIWCEGPSSTSDLISIVEHNIRHELSLSNQDGTSGIGKNLVNFIHWFKTTEFGKRTTVSIRDVLTWVAFINSSTEEGDMSSNLDVSSAYVHGACLTLLDAIGSSNTSTDNYDLLKSFKISCIEYLLKQVDEAKGHHPPELNTLLNKKDDSDLKILNDINSFGIHPFLIKKGSHIESSDVSFMFEAPTTCLNALRIMRSMQIPSRAILLEGNPGVGKTSLVTALALITGHKVTRINLSEQTDISDLFGADLPVEGSVGGTFAWRDGPFLKALKQGHWILLDELNLASQSVIEGLNSVLDHRGEIFIPELGKCFSIEPGKTKIFGCQNPQRQGGARKGLPQSFLNRFTQVFMEPLTKKDLKTILLGLNPTLSSDLASKMVEFCSKLSCIHDWNGGPWEWNLRDLNFWIKSMTSQDPGTFVSTVFAARMRSSHDRQRVLDIYHGVFGDEYPLLKETPTLVVSESSVQLGRVKLSRLGSDPQTSKAKTELTQKLAYLADSSENLLVLRSQLPHLTSLALCVDKNWMPILIGGRQSGKTCLVHTLSQLVGKKLYTLPVNSAMDTTELLGGFEQADMGRELEPLEKSAERLILSRIQQLILQDIPAATRLLDEYHNTFHNHESDSKEKTLKKAEERFGRRVESIITLLREIPGSKSLIAKLEVLDSKLKQRGLKAGGTFEWVDSLLVKCLEEGHWLLVDNVNLCPGSVLDRLNGLLEPNGVLVIGERGVTASGLEVTIKPHPDFRIFLTMDPRYGDISRAMRNRGIEIFIETPHLSQMPPLDLHSMLFHMGFELYLSREALIDIHSRLELASQAIEEIQLSRLLDASKLAAESWKRGFPLISSVRDAFFTVYLKGRMLSRDLTFSLSYTLEEAIALHKQNLSSSEMCIKDSLPYGSLTLQTYYIQNESVLCSIRQQSSLLVSFLNAFKLNSSRTFFRLNVKDIIGCKFQLLSSEILKPADYSILDITHFVLITFYILSTSKDVILRNSFIESLLDNIDQNNKFVEIVTTLSQILRDIVQETVPKSEEPWDLRLFSGSLSTDPYNWSNQNKIQVLMFYKVILSSSKLFNMNETQETTRDWKTMTVMQYSQAVKKGEVTDSLPQGVVDTLVCEVSSLVSEFDRILLTGLTCNETSLDVAHSCALLYTVAWKFRLENAANRRLFSSKGGSSVMNKLSDITTSQLLLHYKWFTKHTLPVLLRFISNSNIMQSESVSLLKTVQMIVKSLEGEFMKFVSLSKRLVRDMHPPHPPCSAQQCNLGKMLQKLELEFGMSSFQRGRDFETLLKYIASPQRSVLQQNLSFASNLILTNTDLDQAEELLKETEKNINILKDEFTESSVSNEVKKAPNDSKLWPLLDLFGIQLSSLLKTKLICGTNDSWLESACSWISSSSSLYPSHITWLNQAIERARTNSSDELIKCLFILNNYSSHSSASRNPFKWIQSSEMDLHDIPPAILEVSSSEHFPMISVIISSLIRDVTKQGTGLTSLSSHSNITLMLKKIKQILWTNSPFLFSPQLDFLRNEEECLKVSFKQLLLTVLKCLSKSCENNDNINDITDIVLEHLKTMISDVDSKSYSKYNDCEQGSPVEQLMSSLNEIKAVIGEIERSTSSEDEKWALIGKGWLFFGQAQLVIFSSLDSVDPVQKKSLKSEYARDELNKLEMLLSINEIYKTMLGFVGYWPFEKEHRERIDFLKNKLDKLSKDVAVRPYPPLYHDIIKDLSVVLESICSFGSVKSLSEKLSSSDSNEKTSSILNEAHGWITSIESWIDNLNALYSITYPDIIVPPLLALSNMSHGIRILSSIYVKTSVKEKIVKNSAESCLIKLSTFPICNVNSALNLLDGLDNTNISSLLEQVAAFKNCQSPLPPSSSLTFNKLRLAKSWLHLLRTLSGSVEWKQIRPRFLHILDTVVKTWEVQLKEEEERIAKEESIYVFKKSLTEEEQDNLEIAELFPTYRESDFADLEENLSLEDTCKKQLSKAPSKKTNLTHEDIDDICNIHSTIVRENVDTHWISGIKTSDNYKDHMNCLNGRLQLFRESIVGNHLACSKLLDHKAFTSLFLSIDLSRTSHKFVEKSERLYDFYRDSNVEEVRKCVPLLNVINTRVLELKSEWPDHPTLSKILEIIQRVVSFDASSPLVRFLTGIELLLSQVYLWEENAHSGVSLAQHAASLTAQIIEWRKLELHSWKGALHASSLRLVSKASKWWFYLYSLINDYLFKEESTDGISEIINSLEMFMERSTLGEYSTRLQLLFTFHCHTTLMTPSEKQETLSCVFWNLFTYYHQFSQPVANQIKDLSLPIEKKIKDFVKIARWNDINYWSIKSSAEKTHRTLHKHIKEFERVLQQSVSNAMTRPEVISDKKSKRFFVKNYLSTQELPALEENESLEVLQGSIDYVKKAQKLCKEALVKCTYPKLITNLNQFITDVYHVGLLLSQCEVDPQLTGDKKKSAAKSLLQKKRKAVSDLFKSLTETGLSYRTGLLKNTELKDFTMMEPINVHIALKHFSKRNCDSEWFSSWSNADRLVMSAIAGSSMLNTLIVKPHKDISPQNIERIRGFTSQLLGICFNEKITLTNFIKQFYATRSCYQNLDKICRTNSSANSDVCSALKDSLKEVTVECVYILDQFQIILDTCPEKSQLISGVKSTPSIVSYTEGVTSSFKNDPNWESAKAKLTASLEQAKKINELIQVYDKQILFLENAIETKSFIKLNKYLPKMFISPDFQNIIQGYSKLAEIKKNIVNIVKLFEVRVNNEIFKNPFTNCFDNLIKNIEQTLEHYDKEKDNLYVNKEEDLDNSLEDFKTKTNRFISKILFIIQEFYKIFCVKNEELSDKVDNIEDNVQIKVEDVKEDENKEEDMYESIEEGHIKQKLVESFSNVLSVFKIEDINNEMLYIIEIIGMEDNHTLKSKYFRILSQCMPLLDQLLFVYQYFIVEKTQCLKTLAKLSSTLCTLFTNFAKKGFNIPEELLCDIEGEEGGESAKGGMGLGDGEGEKDVSDQIESQDQLEDAKRPEDYENPPEDKDCKEEEKGIEVSDDFGGKLQDLEKKEGEEGDDEGESEGEEDPDKEMGETDNAADLLDQQVWGGESDEEEEGEMPEDDRGDKGVQQGDKEMGAKDDSKKATEEQQPGPPSDDKKEEEINEMKDSEMDDDQIDPYYGKQQAYPEVEPLDLEDDLNLDNEEGGKDQDDGDADMDNPFEPETEEPKELPEEAPENDKGADTKDGDDGKTDSGSEDEGGNETGDMGQDTTQQEGADEEEEGDESRADKDAKMEINEEEEEKEINQDKTEEAVGSEDKPSDNAAEASQQKYGSRDEVKVGEEGESCQEENTAQGEDKEGVGTAETSLETGGHQGKAGQGKRKGDKTEVEQKKSKPGQSDVDRTLGEFSEPVQKKLKTIGTKEGEEQQKDEEEKEGAVEDETADFYQHIKEAKGQQHDSQTIDAATQEQAEKQPVINKEDEKGEELKEEDEPMELDEDEVKPETKEELKAEKMEEGEADKKNKEKRKGEGTGDLMEEGAVEVEGDYIETMGVTRGTESTYHTNVLDNSDFPHLDEARIQSMRQHLENQLASWNQTPGNTEAVSAWEKLCNITEELARQLSQELRLVLEPTTASSLKGDFRTGRRINMRKVIPYIASQFRKDKIWLRRTKPSKREYQIILAIDDSSSMADNHSKELAFESLALVSKALGLLEAGDLSVVSFGETIKVLHRLGDNFDQHSGGRLVQEFSFEQRRTRVGALVEFAISQLSAAPRRSDAALAQLLVIVSDGRGVMSEGEDTVRSAVRTAISNNLFIVFLIIDNPTSKDSILDIRMPKFKGGKLLEISSYMDNFPFPFYVILRDINNLPSVLSDALRQWFELVTNTS